MPTGGLGDELVAVFRVARRRMSRDRDRQIDTAHLLHSLVEQDPRVRSVIGDAARTARLLGYLAQRSIGYGLRWQCTVEAVGTTSVVTGGERFSPLAASAVEDAFRRAASRGDFRPRGTDLLAAIVTEPGARAVEVLVRCGIDVAALRDRLVVRRGAPTGDSDPAGGATAVR